VQSTGAPLLISANPGCSLQIALALAERGQDIAVAHTAEVLDASIRGRPLRQLGRSRPALLAHLLPRDPPMLGVSPRADVLTARGPARR
jgi:hypothetical protein